MRSTKCKPSPCPQCRANLDVATSAVGTKAYPGAVSVCLYCGHMLELGEGLVIRSLAPEKFLKLEHEQQLYLGVVREQVMKDIAEKKAAAAAPRVVHLQRERYDVRIDRQTHWGNPFVIGKDGNREQVIAKYRAWIMQPDNAHMIEMAKKELRGKVLGCWCAPKPCHGDVLLEIANG